MRLKSQSEGVNIFDKKAISIKYLPVIFTLYYQMVKAFMRRRLAGDNP
jgi:hypothetical protein